MQIPRGDEYLLAVQNPKTAFNDLDLKTCKFETDRFGLPKPYSGGFTTTFHLIGRSQQWAARCFTRKIPDLKKRYESIGKFLKDNSNSYLINAECIDQGIRINSNWYPIIKMQWIDGEQINLYIDKNIEDKNKISSLSKEFLSLVHNLEKLGVAHGDLQHGNILVKNDKLFLIDYDGFFLPELKELKPNEIGHINYQHPKRDNKYYNENIDRFSAIVIYLGLRAVELKASLWQKYNNSENILFSESDFVNVNNSSLLKDISAIKELAILADHFKFICQSSFENIPTLDQFIAGNINYKNSIEPYTKNIHTLKSQYPILDVMNSKLLSEHIGERVEVIGLLTDYHIGRTYNKQIYIFLNFGSYPSQQFTIILWPNCLSAFKSTNIDPCKFIEKWIKAIGVLQRYEKKYQMTIEHPSQIQLLSSETEAKSWLKTTSNVFKEVNRGETIKTEEAIILNKLYANRSVAKPSVVVKSTTIIQNNSLPANTNQATKTTYKALPSKNKKPNTQVNAYAFATLLGIIGGVLFGLWAFIPGAVIGYYLGKRL